MKTELKRRKGIINVTVEKTDTGYSAYDENYPVYITGRTAAELLKNLKEAINFIRDDFEKILVITHIEEIKDAFPARIEVEKTPSGSTFKLVS